MLVPALLTTLVVFIGLTDELTLQFQTTRAIVIGPLVGLLLGDLQTGLIIGASVELMFLSNVIVGAANIPDVTMAAGISTALAITGGLQTEVAIALAVPVALFGQFMDSMKFQFGELFFSHLADRPAAKGNVRGVMAVPVAAIFILSLLFTVPTFLAVYFGPEVVSGIADQIPDRLISAFGSGTGLLAAVGFGMLLNQLSNKKFLPFLFIGYALTAFMGVDIIPVVIIIVSVAVIYMFAANNRQEEGV